MSDFLPTPPTEEAEPASDVGLTPLVDVIFQLLVFFILTSTFAQPTLDVALPQLSEKAGEPEVEAWRIEIDAAGNLAVEGEPVPLKRLGEVVGDLLEEAPMRTNAVLSADEGVPLGKVLKIMQALGDAGLQQLFFEHQLQPSA